MIQSTLHGAIVKSGNDLIASPQSPTHGSLSVRAASAPIEPTPSLAAVVVKAMPATSLSLRVRLLQLLMIPIGPLAMTVLAGGAFAKYAEFARRLPIPISPEDAARVTSSQVAEIARYLEQSDPSVLEQVVVALSRDPTVVAVLGASVAAIAAKLASASLWRGTESAQ